MLTERRASRQRFSGLAGCQGHDWHFVLGSERAGWRRRRWRRGRHEVNIVHAGAARIIERTGGRRPPAMFFVSTASEFIDLNRGVLPFYFDQSEKTNSKNRGHASGCRSQGCALT
jgi:hypothetical protein